MFVFGAALPKHVRWDDCAVTWGARAIWPGFTTRIDCLPDRQQRTTPEQDEPDPVAGEELAEWGRKSWSKLQEWCENVSQSSSDMFLYEEGPFGLRATPNGSYGYLYIRAWRLTDEAQKRVVDAVNEEVKDVNAEPVTA